VGSVACEPAENGVFQLTVDDKTNTGLEVAAGHSFLLACLGKKDRVDGLHPVEAVPGGCVVLQGYAGLYGLSQWLTGTPSNEANILKRKRVGEGTPQARWVASGKLLPGAADYFGKFQVLNGAKLHEFLTFVNDQVTGGPARSFQAFWGLEDNELARSPDIWKTEEGHQTELKPFSDVVWNKAVAVVQGTRIISFQYAWASGVCPTFANARAYGAKYPSPYCEKVATAKKGVCTFGLGLRPSWNADNSDHEPLGQEKAGYLPKNEDGSIFECCPRYASNQAQGGASGIVCLHQ
jgi:hypothetical protein